MKHKTQRHRDAKHRDNMETQRHRDIETKRHRETWAGRHIKKGLNACANLLSHKKFIKSTG